MKGGTRTNGDSKPVVELKGGVALWRSVQEVSRVVGDVQNKLSHFALDIYVMCA